MSVYWCISTLGTVKTYFQTPKNTIFVFILEQYESLMMFSFFK